MVKMSVVQHSLLMGAAAWAEVVEALDDDACGNVFLNDGAFDASGAYACVSGVVKIPECWYRLPWQKQCCQQRSTPG